MKTHFKISPDPLPEGKPYSMECGQQILNSHFMMTMEPGDTWPDGTNTLQLCSKCLHASIGHLMRGSFYLYGVVEGQEYQQKVRGQGDAA